MHREGLKTCLPASEVARLRPWTETGVCTLGVAAFASPVVVWQVVPNEAQSLFLARRRAEKADDGAASVPGQPAHERGASA